MSKTEIHQLCADLRVNTTTATGMMTLSPGTVRTLLDHIADLERRIDGLLPAPLPGFEESADAH